MPIPTLGPYMTPYPGYTGPTYAPGQVPTLGPYGTPYPGYTGPTNGPRLPTPGPQYKGWCVVVIPMSDA